MVKTSTGEYDSLLGKTDKHSNQVTRHDDQSTDAESGQLQGRSLYLALAFPLLGLFLVALDVTLTSTTSATVASDFASMSLVSWLGSAYLVAMTVVQSLSGSLSDRYGRRSGFLVGLSFFAVGNLVCGLAPTAGTLIVARAVAGAGAGAVNSITTFLFSDLISQRKRPLWQGLGSVAWALGMGLGGIFGGMMNDFVGWRWAFIALTPLTLVVAAGAYFTFVRGLPVHVPGSEGKESRSIDFLGSILLSAMLVCLVLGLNLAEDGIARDSKSRAVLLTLLAVALICLFAFTAVEKWIASNPVVPLHLLGDRSVVSSCLAGFFVASSMHTLLFYVPMLIQVQGFSTSEVGLQMLGEPVGAALGAFMVGLAIRQLGSYAVLKPVSWAMYIVAPLTYYFSGLETPVWVVCLGLAAMGASFGSVLTVNLTGLLANADHRFQAKSTAVAYVFRQSGASIGLALAGTIFRTRLVRQLLHTGSFGPAGSSENICNQCSRHVIDGTGRPNICLAYADALHGVFLFTLVGGILGAVFGMLICNRSLGQESDRGQCTGNNDDVV